MITNLVSRLLDTAEASDFLKVSVRTLENWRARGIGPRYIRLGSSKGVRYRLCDLEVFANSKIVKVAEDHDGR